MKKDEYIAKYGEVAWEQRKERNSQLTKKWCQEHKEQRKRLKKAWHEQHKDYNKDWYEKHKEQCDQRTKKWQHGHYINGCTQYCTKNYELIENYELAKADNFDPKKWHLHHRLENYWSSATLKRKGLYYEVNPEALSWLPYKEHMRDRNCKDTKWHKRSLEI